MGVSIPYVVRTMELRQHAMPDALAAVSEMMRQWSGAEGGPGRLLVADKNRKKSLFTHDPSVLAHVMSEIDAEGSEGLCVLTC